MKPRHFIDELERAEIVKAIREAERKTSGEIRVFISRHETEDALATAQAHFLQMGMQKTRERNGVLIFVAPRSHQFAVVGDTAIHQRCGDEFWNALATEMSGHFRESEFTRGLVHAIRKTGDILAVQFPRRTDDRNELPDDIAQD